MSPFWKSSRPPKTSAPSSNPTLPLEESWLRQYGDLLFDFCSSILWSQSEGKKALRQILNQIKKAEQKLGPTPRYERAWILKTACQVLQNTAQKSARKLSPSEQAMLDAVKDPQVRLNQLESYFHRLHLIEQMILLLRDKYGIPYPEIASALGMPEGSLKVLRQQSLDALENWIWGTSSP